MYSDLRSKLEMYKKSQLNKEPAPKTIGPDVHELLNGTICSSEDGSFFVVEKKYPLTYVHGPGSIGILLEFGVEPFVKICGLPNCAISLQDFMFLDTETTGLSGGTGTVAFLIGIGFFEDDCFVLRQYFMRDYDEEYAMLKALNEVLLSYKGLVTFNGKSFDWNLLQTRFTFNRLRPALKNPAHIDLLYPSRTLWKLKLESCRLSSLEKNILEKERIEDIPGSMIPGVYFKYLDDRNAGDIKKVLDHNETDILSMISLMIKISSLLKNPGTETEDGWELLGTGNIFEKSKDSLSAIDCYNLCSVSDSLIVKETSMKKLAQIYKRNKDYGKAIEQLEAALACSRVPNISVMIELAKLYEHKEKDILKAQKTVQEAINASLLAGLGNNLYLKDLKMRAERLNKKAGRLT